ncbi:hypothetical protein KC363_g36 [Hortaea werneckii]|nr:hypothetical protein KC363_g36 [Hortaea werneckii]
MLSAAFRRFAHHDFPSFSPNTSSAQKTSIRDTVATHCKNASFAEGSNTRKLCCSNATRSKSPVPSRRLQSSFGATSIFARLKFKTIQFWSSCGDGLFQVGELLLEEMDFFALTSRFLLLMRQSSSLPLYPARLSAFLFRPDTACRTLRFSRAFYLRSSQSFAWAVHWQLCHSRKRHVIILHLSSALAVSAPVMSSLAVYLAKSTSPAPQQLRTIPREPKSPWKT